MPTVNVQLGERSYDIAITTHDRDGIGPFARTRSTGTLAFVVSDTNVGTHASRVANALQKNGFRIVSAEIPAGESSKSLECVGSLYDRLVDAIADRKTLVVAVGGGVVGDLAGFVAATWNRGVALLMVPTTLLAMVDSSVGGKVGINHARGKNLIGAFHQPIGVWIDTDSLSTLPDREYRSGLAEVVKYGVILDPAFFEYLEANVDPLLRREPRTVEHIVERSCRLKADVVERDERELTGLRVVLNYGHTFAHAFETISGYGTWLHGEAVAVGMVCASRLAERLGQIDASVTQRQIRLLSAFGLPTEPPRGSVDAWLAVMRTDKKTEAGRLRFVLPTRLGEVALQDGVAETEVRAVLGAG
jgi:3-dehydroquinate synthase